MEEPTTVSVAFEMDRNHIPALYAYLTTAGNWIWPLILRVIALCLNTSLTLWGLGGINYNYLLVRRRGIIVSLESYGFAKPFRKTLKQSVNFITLHGCRDQNNCVTKWYPWKRKLVKRNNLSETRNKPNFVSLRNCL